MSHRTVAGPSIFRDVLASRTDEELAALGRELTPEENADVDAFVACYNGSHAAALGVQDPQLAAEIDALFADGGAR